MRNVIPRRFKSVIATALCGNCEGHTFKITKDAYSGALLAVDIDNGDRWQTFISHLRNEHFYRIESVEV